MDLGPGVKQTWVGSKWPNAEFGDLNSIQEEAANSSSKGGGRKKESLLFYKHSMLWCSALNITAGRQSHSSWTGWGAWHWVELWQQCLLMCSRETFLPNPDLILIYTLKHEAIPLQYSQFQRAGVCFGWLFALKSVVPTVRTYLIIGIISDTEIWPSVTPCGKELHKLRKGKPFSVSFGVQC